MSFLLFLDLPMDTSLSLTEPFIQSMNQQKANENGRLF